jgi:outer membrane biosynthesis protein TonB
VRPSPHEVLDAGAEKIVRMCAPFSPLPENIRQDTDILTIRINWNFANSRQALD